MTARLLTVGLMLLIATTALATNRLQPEGSTGVDLHLAQDFGKYSDDVEYGVGYTLKGRLAASLTRADGDRSYRNGLRGSLELALVRRGGFGFEVGYTRLWRPDDRSDWRMVPFRIFQRVRLPLDLTLIPNATATMLTDQEHDNLMGDVGLDLLWRQKLRLAAEWNVNEDFRYHPLTIRVGYLRVL